MMVKLTLEYGFLQATKTPVNIMGGVSMCKIFSKKGNNGIFNSSIDYPSATNPFTITYTHFFAYCLFSTY